MTTVPVQPRSRRAFLSFAVLASALAVGIGIGAGVGAAADQRLDLADDALENAAALLQAAQGPGEPDRSQKRFDRAIEKAVAKIDDARALIVKAQETSDNP
jgi:hypothetical protein